jgi:hypothetical protein
MRVFVFGCCRTGIRRRRRRRSCGGEWEKEGGFFFQSFSVGRFW